MKEKITRAVEKYRDLILKAERDIWAMPETGYREEKPRLTLPKNSARSAMN
jgi:metal-dependent amidase/aminoacylase/carboxypeptidase family protein